MKTGRDITRNGRMKQAYKETGKNEQGKDITVPNMGITLKRNYLQWKEGHEGL